MKQILTCEQLVTDMTTEVDGFSVGFVRKLQSTCSLRLTVSYGCYIQFTIVGWGNHLTVATGQCSPMSMTKTAVRAALQANDSNLHDTSH